MKDNIYKFINEYVSYCEESISYKLGVPNIFEFPENSEIKRMLDELRVTDADAYTSIFRLDKDEVLYEYLKFVLKYYDSKKMLRISSLRLEKLTEIPILTIRRFENLQHIASFKMICVLAKSVNLKLNWE